MEEPSGGRPVEEVLEWLAERRIEDVLMPGVLDREDGYGFRIRATHVYVSASDGGYLCARDTDRSGRLTLTVEDSLAHAERHVGQYVDHEADEEYFPVHLADQFVSHGASHAELTRVRYHLGPHSDPDRGVVECLELLIDDRDHLFVDPLNWDGIVLGGAGAFERWYSSRFDVHQRTLRAVTWRP